MLSGTTPRGAKSGDVRAGARLALFLLACASVLPAVWLLARQMPEFGAHPLPYGDRINAAAPAERAVSNAVSAVNFDYRGVDTMGEEFMLLGAVTGTVVLLRSKRGEATNSPPGTVPGRKNRARSDATTLIGRLIAPLQLMFGIYLAVHGMTTPGGGFQGGVIIGSAALLLFIGEGYPAWRKVVRSTLCDAVEGVGATLYVLCGLASLLRGTPFLTNILPFGQFRDVFSGGLMFIENVGVTLAVAGGFAVLFIEFMEETRLDVDEDLGNENSSTAGRKS